MFFSKLKDVEVKNELNEELTHLYQVFYASKTISLVHIGLSLYLKSIGQWQLLLYVYLLVITNKTKLVSHNDNFSRKLVILS